MSPQVLSFYSELNAIANEAKEQSTVINYPPKVTKLTKAKRPKKTIETQRKRKCPDCFVEVNSLSYLYVHAAISHYYKEMVNELSDEFEQVSNLKS